jgi:hypothetical protein
MATAAQDIKLDVKPSGSAAAAVAAAPVPETKGAAPPSPAPPARSGSNAAPMLPDRVVRVTGNGNKEYPPNTLYGNNFVITSQYTWYVRGLCPRFGSCRRPC